MLFIENSALCLREWCKVTGMEDCSQFPGLPSAVRRARWVSLSGQWEWSTWASTPRSCLMEVTHTHAIAAEVPAAFGSFLGLSERSKK